MIHKKDLFWSISLGIIILAYYKFFRPVWIEDDILKIGYYIILTFVLAVSVLSKHKITTSNFNKLIVLYFLNLFLSIVMCNFYWNQPIFVTIIASIPLMSFIIYKYIHRLSISIIQIEKIIWILTIIYAACFLLALAVYPNRIFTGFGELDKAIDMTRGFPRIRLTLMGAAPIFPAFFLSLSKIKKRTSIIWIVISSIIFILIILQLGRQSILLSFILGILFLIKSISIYKKLILIGFSVFLVWFMVNKVEPIKQLIDYSNNQYSSDQDLDDNIRIGAFLFYTTEVSPNTITKILGNGQYSLGNSNYGDFIDSMGRSNGFIPADVGFAHIYLIFGLLGIIIFFMILMKALSMKIAEDFVYAKYYLIFLFLSNIAGNTLLGAIPLVCISLYIIDLGNLEYKNNNDQRIYTTRIKT